jgi:hypothetical protein
MDRRAQRPLWRCPKCGRRVVLARRNEHPRFRRIETISARNHVHHFRLFTVKDVDAMVEGWLREAYEVGGQRHLERSVDGRLLEDHRHGRDGAEDP